MCVKHASYVWNDPYLDMLLHERRVPVHIHAVGQRGVVDDALNTQQIRGEYVVQHKT